MRRPRRSWFVPLALALGLGASACTSPDGGDRPPPSPAASPTSEAPGTLRVAIDAPDGLLPHQADEPAEQWVADAVFDSLTRWGPTLRPVPAAAESWSADPARTVWTFRLRDGATWHDGQPVVAGDFVRAWRLLVRERRLAHLLFDVDGVPLGGADADFARALPAVRALDPATLEVRLKAPNADFPAVVAHPGLAPLPAGADSPAFAAAPVGNGPFSVPEAWSPARFVRVRRFDAWRNGAAALVDEIVFQVLDPETAFLAFQQGRLHLAPIPAGALRQITTRRPQAVWRGERAALYLLGMDHTRPPFDRVELRRALSQAVDRAAMAAQVAEGSAAAAGGLLPAWMPEAVPERCAACERDLAAAAAAFRDAGVSTLRLSFNTGAGHEAVARRLRADLAQAGVSLEFDARDPEEFLTALRAGPGDAGIMLFRLGWQPDAPVAGQILRPLLHSASIPSGPDDAEGLRHNLGRYRAADVDGLLDQARATASPMVRAARYRSAARLAVERDQAVVPLLVYRHRLARDGAVGLTVNPMNQVDWAAVRLRS